MTLKKTSVIFFALSVFSTSCLSQELLAGKLDNDSLYNKLYKVFKSITFNNKEATKLNLPKRKYDSPLFVNDLIPFRSGYIINSISSSWGGKLDVRYNFYYINLSNDNLSKVELEELDTIHSIITDKGTLYASGKKGNQFKVIKYTEKGVEELTFSKDLQNIIQQDYNWIKLGMYKNELIALLNNGVIQYKNNNWEYLENHSLESYLKEMGSKNTRWLFPNENIRIHDDKIYFNYEITQGRTSNLCEMDLQKPQEVNSFFYKHKLLDNSLKEADSYIISNDGSLYVTITRLMTNAIILHIFNDTLSTIVLNGQLKDRVNGNVPIDAHCIAELPDSKIIFAGNGVFEWRGNEITPLIFLDNISQAVTIKIGTFHWNFQPRAAIVLGESKYLVGGLWGGLYIFDISSKSITCLDDLKNRPILKKLF